jgi:heme/copper-type cytochrome/quinol oxidase subunit 3
MPTPTTKPTFDWNKPGYGEQILHLHHSIITMFETPHDALMALILITASIAVTCKNATTSSERFADIMGGLLTTEILGLIKSHKADNP